jgi:RimJ/RimL family protein N-acetyltransferase
MVTLRAAAPEDEERLLTWRNDDSVREVSFSQDVVSPDEHHVWFLGKLRDPGCTLLIIEDGGCPIGQVRLDTVTPGEAEISIALAAGMRGRHLGRAALRLAATEAHRLGITDITARVRIENEPSLRAFRAAGYDVVGDDGAAVELRLRVTP